MAARKDSRRAFISAGVRGLGAVALGGSIWGYLLHEQSQAIPYALRPPGALDENDFLATCIKCGQCVTDCPYDTLQLAEVGGAIPIGTPYFFPRSIPCYMCPDIPCVKACPSGALDSSLTKIEEAKMGIAVLVDEENCLSYRGLRCEICHRECPLMNKAITVEPHPRLLSKHAVFVPVVHSDACTGCGMCEKACPLPEAAIKVLPPALAKAKPGEHYEFGWTTQNSLTKDFLPQEEASPLPKEELKSGLDYLNDSDLQEKR